MENERNLMTTTEAARYLGLKPSYLYKMMMRRAIPYYKPNGKLCFFAKEGVCEPLRLSATFRFHAMLSALRSVSHDSRRCV